jgi:DNA-binding transcriptional LysR family regulator
MDLRQLEYFAAVARHRHFGRAAEDLYVTQSAVSQQVRRLEAELGLALLERTSRGVELTAAGVDLLTRAEAILADVAGARAAMDEHAGSLRGGVRIAATTGDALALPPALAQFHRAHPSIRIALRQGSADEVLGLFALTGQLRGIEGGSIEGEGPRSPHRNLGVDRYGSYTPTDGHTRPGPPSMPAVPGRARRTASWLVHPGPPVGTATVAPPAPRHALSLLSRPGGLSPVARLLHAHLLTTLPPAR